MLVSSKYRLQAAPPFQFQGTRHHALSPGPSRVQLLSVVMLAQVSCEHAEALQPPTTSPSEDTGSYSGAARPVKAKILPGHLFLKGHILRPFRWK